jgi:hypothetical protein
MRVAQRFKLPLNSCSVKIINLYINYYQGNKKIMIIDNKLLKLFKIFHKNFKHKELPIS